MEVTFKVPIRNLFFLLSYANDMPEIVESLNEVEDDAITYDFLVEQFHREVKGIIRRGLVRNYVSRVSETSSLGGRLLLTESLPHIMRRMPVVVCEKDEYVADVLLNQIMKTTLASIHGNRLVKEQNRMTSYRLWEQLADVSPIHLHRRLFYDVNLNRHNMYYKRMIHLARLLYEFALLSHRQGDWSLFMVDINDRALSRLFETFLHNFYKLESGVDYKVGSRRMSWKLTGNAGQDDLGIFARGDVGGSDVSWGRRMDRKSVDVRGDDVPWDRGSGGRTDEVSFAAEGVNTGDEKWLPTMLTDASLYSRDGKRAIIIDAKFYRSAFTVFEDKESFISNHMYQMFTYVQHQPQEIEQVRGILVYPYKGKHFNEIYRWDERISLQLTSLDLRAPWQEIKAALLELV